ncbi:DedA family protein [Cytophagales bacterium WSM2-2]|nr:DedA family protein [Cytophagales bacterium WSM2-2]
MEKFINEFGYFALMVGTFFEGETAILTASSLIYQGLFEFPWTVLAAFSGSFVSDWIYYLIGRINGKIFVAKRPALQSRIEPLTRFFQTHKFQILFSYRFLYGFRILIPLVIGMSGLKPTSYLLYSTLTGLLWATIVSTIGYWTGRMLHLETKTFEENFIFIMIGFAILGLTIGFLVKRMTMRTVGVVDQK